MRYSTLVFCAAALWLEACSTSPKCPYKPEPIFSKDLPHVVEYRFERQGAQSLESLLLDTQVLLEIGQEVCRDTRQEFRFTVPGDYSRFPDSMWLKEAARQLVFLSSFSPKQAPLKAWADALEAARPAMRLGEEAELQPGIYARVDRIVSPEQSTLLLILAQREQQQ
ncbi:MAG: hypothetical protein RMJ33_12000 [Saprospiraceae bacterium]|nr:hypothetical protein [Saprospiraceae bacterium]MDW8230551.1 hypothetical protein [Saprospiraceae bacterium]